MWLGIHEGWMARRRKVTSCPACGSPRTRYSRRRYDGFAASMFALRPVKCLACNTYFPVAAKGSIPPRIEADDLNIPFRPIEFERGPARNSGEIVPLGLAAITSRWPGRRCPDCGSKDSRPIRLDMAPSNFRLDAWELYRCSVCNGSFKRTSLPRFVALVLILCAVIGGLAYLLSSMRGGGSKSGSPHLKQNQVPKLPPPVFR